MSIEFVEKDQQWQNEQTNYWFMVDGESWAISDSNGTLQLLDCCGYPVESCNDHGRLLDTLTPHYEDHIDD